MEKIFYEQKIVRETVKLTMEKIWKVDKSMEFHEIGANCFVITFANSNDKNKVLEGCLWLFDNYLFVLKFFYENAQTNRLDFDPESFWVQMHNLPLGYIDQGMGEQIGGMIGNVVDIDVQEDGLAWGRYLRVNIECDLKKSIVRGRTMDIGGKRLWVPLQYEKLSKICFRCEKIVHGQQGCTSGDSGNVHSIGREAQYGPWLRASSDNHRQLERKGNQRQRESGKNQNYHSRSSLGTVENLEMPKVISEN